MNAAMRLPERQVLPRPIDHAIDMAHLTQRLGKTEVASVLILDFQDAFMSLPIDERERRYNATVLPNGIRRRRDRWTTMKLKRARA